MDPFIGEVRVVSFPFAPTGWAFCDGSLVPIRSNTALFSLIGVQYGGDGVTNFALPDFRGRVATGSGQGPGMHPYNNGSVGGYESYTLLSSELGSHTHSYAASDDVATTNDPTLGSFASPNVNLRQAQLFDVPSNGVANTGMIGMSSTVPANAHENRGPVLAMNYIIALAGVFPQRP